MAQAKSTVWACRAHGQLVLLMHGVHIVTYMRISVTDRCNERCAYCLPHDVTVEWLPKGQILTYEEILRVARVATSLGVTKFRVTGGEPLVRKNVAEFIGELNKLPGVTDIGLSTNATLLAPLAHQLRAAGVRKVNISLDTLDAGKYRELTGNGRLADALAGIDAALEAKFPQVKLNAVMMKGKNDDEIFALIDFAAEKRLTLRFIELMPISTSEVLTDDNFISIGHVRRVIEQRYELEPAPEPPTNIRGNGPAIYYRPANLPIHLGFIGAMTNLHFCDSCNKVRLTADGRLRPCLGAHMEFDLKSVLRAPNTTDDMLRQVFVETIRNKPEEHEFRNNYVPGRKMVAIGG
ncbi:MAG TPA: GTP 3',8-cyclase MoaA [Verrucomicrobiae bacterium]|nr:GTP 3',8-cyclase MoaA [Verrucomicrobiae bacterium]